MSIADFERAAALYAAIAVERDGAEDLRYIVIPGAPVSKARARFANGRAYSTKAMRTAEELTAWHLRGLVAESGPFPGNVALGCIFFRPNMQRIDADNLLKHVCDSANGILWADDSQITAIMGLVEYDPVNPRTIVVIGQHASSLKRGADAAHPCAVCNAAVPHGGGRTCSSRCATELRGYKSLAVGVACAQCGVSFRRRTATQKLCSAECRVASMTAKNKSKGKPRSRCSSCGQQLTHSRGGQCRECWRVSHKSPVNGAEIHGDGLNGVPAGKDTGDASDRQSQRQTGATA